MKSIDIFAPPGQFVGRVKQDWSLCAPSFSILNEANEKVLKIKGPYCICGEAEFKVSLRNQSNMCVCVSVKRFKGLMEVWTKSRTSLLQIIKCACLFFG